MSDIGFLLKILYRPLNPKVEATFEMELKGTFEKEEASSVTKIESVGRENRVMKKKEIVGKSYC